MRIAVSGIGRAGRLLVLVWSNEQPTFDAEDEERGFRLTGSPDLVARAVRSWQKDIPVYGLRADLSEPHHAFRTMVGVLREHGRVNGPIDMAAMNEGEPVSFVPEPDAQALLHRSPPAGAGVTGS